MVASDILVIVKDEIEYVFMRKQEGGSEEGSYVC